MESFFALLKHNVLDCTRRSTQSGLLHTPVPTAT